MVSCYAPKAGRSHIEKEEFWWQVEGVIINTDINQEVIVGGDMNGHVGQVANGFHDKNNTTTTVYFNEVVFPSILGLTSPMAFPQHSPPS